MMRGRRCPSNTAWIRRISHATLFEIHGAGHICRSTAGSRSGRAGARMVAQNLTFVTNITLQAPALVSLRTSEVLIHRPSSRTASTKLPLKVTTSPGRSRANSLAMIESCGMTCVLALVMIASWGYGCRAPARQ